MAKPVFAYINFFSTPQIKDPREKLERFKGSYDFLFLLESHFEVVVIDHIGITASYQEKGVRFEYLKRTHNRKGWYPFKTFMKIRKLNPDVLYIQGLGYPHFLVMLLRFLKRKPKVIVQDHANSLPKMRWHGLFKKADAFVSHYIFTSRHLADAWISSGLISSGDKIIEGVEGSTQFTAIDPTAEPLTFLWVGRLDANKDPLTILHAFAKLITSQPQARLSMFYREDPLLEEVKTCIQELQLSDHVSLKGQLPYEQLEAQYRSHRYFLLGSHKEGGPYSLIESMACGCVPIVTNIEVFQAMTDGGRLGAMFTPGSVDELGAILQELDVQDYKGQRAAVLEYFQAKLSHQAIANRLLQASGY